MTKLSGDGSQTGQRRHWMGVLARANGAVLQRYWCQLRLDRQGEVAVLRAPEAGLVMVRGRAGGAGQRFNLGEMTVTRCSVCIANGPVGHAYVRGRNKRHAELAARFDALLQVPCCQRQLIVEVIEPLARAQSAAAAKRARKAAATKVDFFTLVRGEDA